MNQLNKSRFDRIKRAMESYKTDVKTALARYRVDAEEAKQFKDETGYIAAAKTNARNAINKAEHTLTSAVSGEVDGLHDELLQHMTTRPAAAFLDALRVYADFSITPEKIEVEALIKQNGGNALGVRAINRVLEQTDAAYRVEAPDSAQFEADIAALERLAQGGIRYAPEGYHTELTAIYKDTPRLVIRDDGSTYDAGYRWDSVSLITATASFNSQLATVDEMAGRWTDNVLPSFGQVKDYKPRQNESGETISAAQQFVEDYEATADATTVTTTPDISRAREMGHDRAQANAKAREIVNHYATA